MTQEKEGHMWGVWLVWLDCIRRRPWLQVRPSGDGGGQGRPDHCERLEVGLVHLSVRTHILVAVDGPSLPLFLSLVSTTYALVKANNGASHKVVRYGMVSRPNRKHQKRSE